MEIQQGWKEMPDGKWHYFKNGKSLCNKWGTLNKLGFETGNDDSPDNCKSCKCKIKYVHK